MLYFGRTQIGESACDRAERHSSVDTFAMGASASTQGMRVDMTMNFVCVFVSIWENMCVGAATFQNARPPQIGQQLQAIELQQPTCRVRLCITIFISHIRVLLGCNSLLAACGFAFQIGVGHKKALHLPLGERNAFHMQLIRHRVLTQTRTNDRIEIQKGTA